MNHNEGKASPELSIVVPCYNAAATLGDLLESLASQDWQGSWELIIADNGSTDDTLALLDQYRSRLPEVRVVQAREKQGAGYARNVATREARGESVLFCDADDVVGDRWLAVMAAALAEHPFVFSTFEYERLNDPRQYAIKRNPFRHILLKGHYKPYLTMVPASGTGIRRSLHLEVGGFDDKVRYCEDCDYGWRLQLRGIKPVLIEEAVLHVRLRETGWQLFRQARNWGEYNALLIKRYKPHGMPTIPIKHATLAWLRLLKTARKLGNQTHRDQWLWDVGYRVGQINGRFRFRASEVALKD